MLSLLLKKQAVKEVLRGCPWVWRGMIEMNSELEMAIPGSLVEILDNKAKKLAVGYINPRNILACRVLSFKGDAVINQQFFHNIFQVALKKRSAIFQQNYYRLVHSESDGLPGLVVDRFGDIIVCQTSTAGMENLKDLWIPALQQLLQPASIIMRDDIPVRKKEGLELFVKVYSGVVPEYVQVLEHNRIYLANLLTGQKTGWFYDQRANRSSVAGLANGKNILDLYSHSGGFGIAAGLGGAKHVTMVDSSALALELASQAAALNNVADKTSFVRDDAYRYLENSIKNGAKFDVIMADPPAFIKEKKYLAAGLKGYEKLAYLCALVVGDGGVFCIASCSHHAAENALQRAVEDGLKRAGRKFKLIHKAGADKDHPVHPYLAESRYLKFFGYELKN